MKRIEKILLSLMIAAVLVSITVPGYAEGNAATTREYTVTVYSGVRGTINGADKYVETVQYGDSIDLTRYSSMSSLSTSGGNGAATVTQSSSSEKFSVKSGAKLAGSDNNDTLAVYPKVTGDTDFVLVYYVPGEMKGYTVYYKDRNGNDLATPTSGAGGVNTRVTVGCKSIDGYTPNAYNLIKTLSDNEAENVFTFVYTRTVPQVIVVDGGGGNGGNGNAAGGNANAADGNANAADGNANAADGTNIIGDGTAAEGTEGGAAEAEAVPEGPVELIDLDETEVPLANLENEKKDKMDGREKTLLFGGIALSCGLLAAIAYIILNKREKEEEE